MNDGATFEPPAENQSPHNATANEGNKTDSSTPPVSQALPTPPSSKPRKNCRPDQTPWWKSALELGAVIVGVAVALIYWHQLNEMKKSVVITHDALVRSNRPWVGVETATLLSPPSVKMVNGTPWVDLVLEVQIRNYGSSPALATGMFTNPAFAAWRKQMTPTQFFKTFSDRACIFADGNEVTKEHPDLYGLVIFPNQPPLKYKTGAEPITPDVSSETAFQLIGCISYRDQFNENIHHTTYCFNAKMGQSGPLEMCQVATTAN